MQSTNFPEQFISPETREKWQYFAYFELFFMDIDDEFNTLGGEEIRAYVEREKLSLEPLGIHLEYRNECADMIVTIKVQQDSESTWQHLEQILFLLQRRFLCTFRDYYVKGNLDSGLQEGLRSTIPSLTEGNGVSRRLIYQQTLATRWRLQRHLMHLGIMERTIATQQSEFVSAEVREKFVEELRVQRDAIKAILDKYQTELPICELTMQVVGASSYLEIPQYAVHQDTALNGLGEENSDTGEIVEEFTCKELGKTFYRHAGNEYYSYENGEKVANFVVERQGENLVVVSLRTRRVRIFEDIPKGSQSVLSYEVGNILALHIAENSEYQKSPKFYDENLDPIIFSGASFHLENPEKRFLYITIGDQKFVQAVSYWLSEKKDVVYKYFFLDTETGKVVCVEREFEEKIPISTICNPTRVEGHFFEKVGTFDDMRYYILPKSYNKTNGTFRILRDSQGYGFIHEIDGNQWCRRFFSARYSRKGEFGRWQVFDAFSYDEELATFQSVFVTRNGRKFPVSYLYQEYPLGAPLRDIIYTAQCDFTAVFSRQKSFRVTIHAYDPEICTFMVQEGIMKRAFRRLMGRKEEDSVSRSIESSKFQKYLGTALDEAEKRIKSEGSSGRRI